MALLTLISPDMIIKATIVIILIHLIIIKQSSGHLGCSGDLVPCLNQTHCIDLEQVCTDYPDCVDEDGQKICNYCESGKSDSLACVTHIESHLVFECLSPNDICDGRNHCINKRDEYACGTEKCGHDYWLCQSGGCIAKNLMCDGHKDCSDGSDEGDFCHSYLCGSDQIHCPTGECISKIKKCDGIPHCRNGFDEENCPNSTANSIKDSCSISSNNIPCSTSKNPICISDDRICDGFKDCPLGDDESDCDKNCNTLNSICPRNSSINCIQHPTVDQICRCVQPGYRLTSPASNICQDFNECTDPQRLYCSFNCINTDGSYNCTCPTDYILDEQIKTCRKMNDSSKPNLLILHDNHINLYNIFHDTNHYLLKLFNTINIENNQQFDHIEYDLNQMFVIYYDQNQHAILCKSSTNLKSFILISNISIIDFAYNANEKSLFIIESISQTLRIYTPISCDISHEIQMHSWPLDHTLSSIQSMDIDLENRQFIFATNYDFLISNMSQPNVTKTVYSTDRKIKRFIYEPDFKRIFWTTTSKIRGEIFAVYTCDHQFEQCHDTSVTLPSAWPFSFFNDGFISPSLSLKSLDIIQLYGTNRFSENYLISTKEAIRSFVFLNSNQNTRANLCTKTSSLFQCKHQICLQINSSNIDCLPIDGYLLTKELSTSDSSNSDQINNVQSLINNDVVPENIQQIRKTFRYLPSNTTLFFIIVLGIVGILVAFVVKRYHNRLYPRAAVNEQRQTLQGFTNDEPNLEEFNVFVDERVSKQCADYAQEILFENANILHIGRRRDSV